MRDSEFHEGFVDFCQVHYPRVFRYLNRVSADPELAADLAQESFARLYRRGAMPELPAAWVITVALNLFRNERSTRARRTRLSAAVHDKTHADAPIAPDAAFDALEARQLARAAVDRLPERERSILLLRAEGFSYRDIAAALQLNEASIGTLLARARAAFREAFEDARNADG